MKLLIVQCGQFAFVCMYIYIYVYPSQVNSVGAVSVVPSPDYEPRSTGLTMRRSRRGIGPTRRRSTSENDCARAEMERVSGLSVIVLENENENN